MMVFFLGVGVLRKGGWGGKDINTLYLGKLHE